MGVIGALATGGLMLDARRVLPRRRGILLAVAGAGAWLAVIGGRDRARRSRLALSGTVPLGTVLPAMLGVHVVIGLGEAVITVAAVSALMATRPDLIGGWAPPRRRPRASARSPGGVTHAPRPCSLALAVAVALATASRRSRRARRTGWSGSPATSGFLDEGGSRRSRSRRRRRTTRSRAIDDPRLATAAAGFAGTLLVFALGAGLVAVVRRRPRAA